ncbi:hypothetical protein SAMN05892883_1111 [Jatrophihabitans sp. GAS493]|uniref:hypothetical protein n=1 Tax=Jatrophihabitans sp. GAS493 TaxID=1907575 RepID=UPI000BB8BDBA|nr:hypothetical protein [Jatrophihabitans sp. GAS493]SOD71616.1 hypothetical protein SAMN05892883_1111 [Jatrophihabitans sp. GAS493]
MRGFAADTVEPLVGEIHAVRSFGLSDDGNLFPVGGSDAPWSPGKNTARCIRGFSHDAPATDCTCGFYAYLDPAWITQRTGITGTVTAVVSCWGQLIAGSRGVRAEFSRIEALYLPVDVPREVVAEVASVHPEVTIFRDVEQMYTEHPLSELEDVKHPRFLAKRPPTARMIIVTRTLYWLLFVALTFGYPQSGGRLIAVTVWSVVAILLAVRLTPMDGPGRSWRAFLLPSTPQLLAIALVPLIAPVGGDLLPNLGLAIATVVGLRAVPRWQQAREVTLISPNRQARELLARWHGQTWRVTPVPRDDWREVRSVGSDGSVATYFAIALVPSVLAGIARLPSLVRLGLADVRPLYRKTGLVSFVENVPSGDWLHVFPGRQLPVDHSAPIRMSVEQVIAALGLPRPALDRPTEWTL